MSSTNTRLSAVLDEYEKSHRHPTNVLIHEFCVPAIVWSTYGLLHAIPAPVNLALVIWVVGFIYCLQFKDWRLLTLYVVLLSAIYSAVYYVSIPVWVYAAVFVVAWIGQFIGHHIEGKQPAFFENLTSLFVGPIWVALKGTKSLFRKQRGDSLY